MGTVLDDQTMQRVTKLHTVLRPYLLRRLKRDVEKELPSKYEHLVLCPLSKRQRFLYDEFMSRAQTRDALQSGVYQKIANILMQLRKVCNHPDLFEVRPIVTSFAMPRSAIADFEIKELLIRRQALFDDEEQLNLDVLGLRFISRQNTLSSTLFHLANSKQRPVFLTSMKLRGSLLPKISVQSRVFENGLLTSIERKRLLVGRILAISTVFAAIRNPSTARKSSHSFVIAQPRSSHFRRLTLA